MPNITKKISRLFSFLVLSLVLILPSTHALAIYDGVRDVHWDGSRCKASDLKFDPLTPNKDYTFEITNATCAAYVASVGVLMASTGALTKAMCIPSNSIGQSNLAHETLKEAAMTPEPSWPTPLVAIGMITRNQRCVNRGLELSAASASCNAGIASFCADVPLASSDVGRCCSSVAVWLASVGTAVGALAAIHSTAQGAYEKARICGHDWYTWAQITENGDESVNGQVWSRGAYAGSYKDCLRQLFTSEGGINDCGISVAHRDRSLTNKYFREYIYGGREFKDTSTGSCRNPWNSEDRI